MTQDEEILNVVRQFFHDRKIDAGKIVPQAKITDLAIDSLMVMELIYELEDRFHVDIDARNFEPTTVQQCVEFMKKLLPPSRAAAA
jgi:acyl carrier protein